MSITIKSRHKSGSKPPQPTNPHTRYLLKLISDYCLFLERKEKPTDEEVRTQFKEYNSRWIQYCVAHSFDPRASLLFNQEVARLWKERYAETTIKKRIRK